MTFGAGNLTNGGGVRWPPDPAAPNLHGDAAKRELAAATRIAATALRELHEKCEQLVAAGKRIAEIDLDAVRQRNQHERNALGAYKYIVGALARGDNVSLQTFGPIVQGDLTIASCLFTDMDMSGIPGTPAAIQQQRIAELEEDRRAFKNFHRQLCERFGYVHDEKDWRRDQLSLIEHIASRSLPLVECPTCKGKGHWIVQDGTMDGMIAYCAACGGTGLVAAP